MSGSPRSWPAAASKRGGLRSVFPVGGRIALGIAAMVASSWISASSRTNLMSARRLGHNLLTVEAGPDAIGGDASSRDGPGHDSAGSGRCIERGHARGADHGPAHRQSRGGDGGIACGPPAGWPSTCAATAVGRGSSTGQRTAYPAVVDRSVAADRPA